jgi:hypothetical protein
MGRAVRYAIFMACIFSGGMAFAQGGACPSGANYIDPANPSGSLVTLSSLGVTSCYYFSKSMGSDSNAGTTESNAQAHLPGMPSYTGKITPAAGQGFILRGGDTWTASDLDLYWQWTGRSGSPIYIGVDLNWYSGGSWTRPVFTCGGASCSYTQNGNAMYTDQAGIQYITVDNIEWKGLYSSTAGYPNYFSIYGSNNNFERNYVHGWVHASAGSGTQDNSAAFAPSQCCGGGLADKFLFNVIDGADSTGGGDSLVCFYQSPSTVAYNVCKNVSNGLEGTADSVHDNWVGPINLCFVPGGCHQNAIFQFGPAASSSSPVFIYNNVVSGNTASGGIVKFWMNGNNANTDTVYAFNNLIYNNASGNLINFGGHNAVSYGTAYFFNNTVECGTDASPGTGAGICGNDGGAGGGNMTINWINNHFIKGDTAAPITCGTYNCVFTTQLTQSLASANGQGYTSGSTYAFQPTSSGGSTIGTGTSEQALCTRITGLNSAAGSACQSDTGYACTYNTSGHTVSCPSRAVVARPSSTAWAVGAYQSSHPGPQPPTAVTATVN